jgi:hypothetical protein
MKHYLLKGDICETTGARLVFDGVKIDLTGDTDGIFFQGERVFFDEEGRPYIENDDIQMIITQEEFAAIERVYNYDSEEFDDYERELKNMKERGESEVDIEQYKRVHIAYYLEILGKILDRYRSNTHTII